METMDQWWAMVAMYVIANLMLAQFVMLIAALNGWPVIISRIGALCMCIATIPFYTAVFVGEVVERKYPNGVFNSVRDWWAEEV